MNLSQHRGFHRRQRGDLHRAADRAAAQWLGFGLAAAPWRHLGTFEACETPWKPPFITKISRGISMNPIKPALNHHKIPWKPPLISMKSSSNHHKIPLNHHEINMKSHQQKPKGRTRSAREV
jgi:hypothetical protein